MRYLLVLFLFVLAVVGTNEPVWAATSKLKGFVAVDVGAHMNNLVKRFSVSGSNSGYTNHLSGYLRLRGGMGLSRKVLFEPSIGMVLPWRTGADGSTRVFTTQTSLDFGIPLFSFLKMRVGPGLHWDIMSSSGSVVRLNNGNTYSNFYTPDRTVHVWNFTTQIGFEITMSKRLSVNWDTYVMTLFDSARRNIKMALTLGYRL